MSADLTVRASRSGAGVRIEPPGLAMRTSEDLEIAFDVAELIPAGESATSPSAVMTSVPDGTTVELGTDPSVEECEVTQRVDGSLLTAGSAYLLVVTFAAGDSTSSLPFAVTVPEVASSALATTDDLATLLGIGSTINTDRAQLLLDLAEDLCRSVVALLPSTARAVVLSVAARAYANPMGIATQTTGPESVAYGPGATGGVYLTRRDVAALKRLAGASSAFSVDTTPRRAMRGYRSPLAQPTQAEEIEYAEETGQW